MSRTINQKHVAKNGTLIKSLLCHTTYHHAPHLAKLPYHCCAFKIQQEYVKCGAFINLTCNCKIKSQACTSYKNKVNRMSKLLIKLAICMFYSMVCFLGYNGVHPDSSPYQNTTLSPYPLMSNYYLGNACAPFDNK